MTNAVKQQEQDLPMGCAPPGALQAYTDAYKARYKPCQHLDAHLAGLRAVVLLDRQQQAERLAKDPQRTELAGRLIAWGENDPNPDYFFGESDDVFTAMQADCRDAAQCILGVEGGR